MEIMVENKDYKYSLVIGILRKKQGDTPEVVLRWDEEKLLERLCAKVSEGYFRKGVFKKPRYAAEFMEHLEKAWKDLSDELVDETNNTPGL